MGDPSTRIPMRPSAILAAKTSGFSVVPLSLKANIASAPERRRYTKNPRSHPYRFRSASFQHSENGRIGDFIQIAKRDRGVRLFSRVYVLESEIPRFQPLAHQSHISLDVLDESFARPFYGHGSGRLRHGSRGTSFAPIIMPSFTPSAMSSGLPSRISRAASA